jgi:hypothetical protein
MLFFSRSPGAWLPATTTEYTSFSVGVRSERAIDLTQGSLAAHASLWTAEDYGDCHRLAAAARVLEAGAIRYRSARDPGGGANLALLDPAGFAEAAPKIEESWHLRFVGARLIALAAFPSSLRFAFDFAEFELEAPSKSSRAAE